MKTFWRKILGENRIWLPIACAFLFINFSKIHDGGTNANARFATLRAMSDDHSFQIDKYADWTIDWAKTPDGHYYSNKAPGPTLVAFPLFWLIDHALYPIQEKNKDEKGRRQAPRGIHKVLISGILQVIPFLIISILLMQEITPAASTTSRFIVLLCVLFGNTAAMLMNAYMGNPFTAVTILYFAYFYLRRQIAIATFFFALTVLSEYTTGALILPFFWLMMREVGKTNFKETTKSIAIGGSIPFLLWCWYHIVCFGGILSLPYKFEMATVVATVEKSPTSLWGFISLLPNPHYLFELLFGTSRGILFTQPWILMLIPLAMMARNKLAPGRIRNLLYFSLASFFILLSINAGFPGWHGGGNPGPRYLAAALPLLGFLIPLFYDDLSKTMRIVFVALISISIVLRGLAYATWILPPVEPLWPYYLAAINNATAIFFVVIFLFAMASALFLTIKKMRPA